MTKKTIREAIIEVLKAEGRPMSSSDIYSAIQAKGLYDFKAKDPANIVRGTLRKNAVGTKSKTPEGSRCFKVTEGGKFALC